MFLQSCELEASGEKAAVSGDNNDSIMRLAWALVHSRNPPDVQRGIAMLEGVPRLLHTNSRVMFNNPVVIER